MSINRLIIQKIDKKLNSISENIEIINHRIHQAANKSGTDLEKIKLIAVSKTKPISAILEALEAGQVHFGENRMQELQTKMSAIEHPAIQWHMIGAMQTNKIKHIASQVHWIHSVGKAKYLNEINKRVEQSNRNINLLIQVNISGEDQKSGCEPTELEGILETARNFNNITIRGLMGMARYTYNPEDVRGEFALLKNTFEDHINLNGENIQLSELSMGMSNDFEVAIEEGATMVRIGSAIFGARN